MTFIDQIKKIPIADYAQRIGYTPVRRGSRYISLKEHDSVMIDTEKNAYWQNSEFVMGRKGGAGSVIDFAMNMRGYDLNTALRELSTMYGIVGNREATVAFKEPKYEKATNEKKHEKGDIELPKAAKSNTAVIKYLTEKRKIKSEIVHSFIDRGLLYQDVKRNCVFHTDRFGCKRSTGEKRFAIDLKGNDYDECFLVKPTHPSKLNNTLIVTEAVIDAMSVMSFLSDKRDYQGYTYLALTGTNKTHSIFNALDKNPGIQTVVLCMDNDEAGRKATLEVSAELQKRGIRIVDFPAKEGKDWNEYIQILAGREPQAEKVNDSAAKETEKDGNSDFFKKYSIDHYDDAKALSEKTGWNLTRVGTDYYVYRNQDDLPRTVADQVDLTPAEINIDDKMNSFQNPLVKDIAEYYIQRGGEPEVITAAPDNVSVETISAVTDAAIRKDVNAEQAAWIYDAMQILDDWNVSNYQQQQQQFGAKAEYAFNEEFMDSMAVSMCNFVKSGKDADYLLRIAHDSIMLEEENYLEGAEKLIGVEDLPEKTEEVQDQEPQRDPEPEPVPAESKQEETVQIPERDYSKPIEIALESTNDYHDSSFKVTDGHHMYRWVCLREDGLAIEPLDNQVYSDPADARMIKHVHPTLQEVRYDDLIDKVYYNREYGMKEKVAEQDKIAEQLAEIAEQKRGDVSEQVTVVDADKLDGLDHPDNIGTESISVKTVELNENSPKWYQQVNDLREQYSMNDIVIELAERSGKETGRDPFEDSPLADVKENLLLVAAAAEFAPEALQALSDTAKDGKANIAFKDDNGNYYPIDVKVKFIDMAKQYASDMQKETVIEVAAEQIEQEQPKLEEQAQSEPEVPEQEVSEEPQPVTEEPTKEEPVEATEQPKEIIRETDQEQEPQGNFNHSDVHVISYRMEQIADQLENLPAGEYEAAKEKYKQLAALYQKVTADVKEQGITLTGEEKELLDESKKWLAEHIASMDSSERVKYELTEGIKGILSSDEYKKWLDTSGKYYARQYSFTNAILVYLQKRDASFTMSYDKWKEYGRQVKKGEDGIRIRAPKMAYEASKGQLFRTIKKTLASRLAENPGEVAKYQLGMSKLTFTMNPQNRVIGLQVDGKDKMIFTSDDHLQQFIERQILGKEPVGYKAVSVFDLSQTEQPEQIWIKENKMLPDEKPVLDENGQIQKNKRGEILIENSEERKARFQTEFPRALEPAVTKLSTEKAAILLEALKAVDQKNGVPVYERSVEEDPELENAYGYFTRKDNYIVLRENMSVEEKLKILFHETAHADLHGDLEKLAAEMNLDKRELGTNVREIQAESVAYALGQQYGVQTENSSFSYLTAYTRGFELQDLQRSMTVIKKEIALLSDDLEAELEERGYDRSVNKIEQKSLEKENISAQCATYINFATEQFSKADFDNKELAELEMRLGANKESKRLLGECVGNCDSRMADANAILAACKTLAASDKYEEQEQQLKIIKMAVFRIRYANENYRDNVESALEVARAGEPRNVNLRKEFTKDAMGTLKKMCNQYPELAKLTDAQMTYAATSKVIRKQAVLLNNDPERFVQMVCDRAAKLPKLASKNGAFIEIVSCEKWTTQKVFEDGAICHPKYADKVIANAEPLLEKLIADEKSQNRFMPTTQVTLCAYAMLDGKLRGMATSIDMGDGSQKGLLDHFQQISEQKQIKEFVSELQKGTTERTKFADKVYVPREAAPREQQRQEVRQQGLNMTTAEWNATVDEQISARQNASVVETLAAMIEAAQHQSQEQTKDPDASDSPSQDSPEL